VRQLHISEGLDIIREVFTTLREGGMTMKWLLSMAVSIGLLFGWPQLISLAVAAPPKDLREKEQLKAACLRLAKEYEEQVAEQDRLLRQGATSESEVLRARYDLAATQLDLAALGNKRDAVLEQSRVLVSLRERQLNLWLKMPSGDDLVAIEVLAAERRLANARFWLAREEGRGKDVVRYLRDIIDISNRELRALGPLESRGLASSQNVEDARRHIAYARYLLAKQEGKPEEAAKQLRIVADMRELGVARMHHLYKVWAVPARLVDWYRVLLMESQHRLAVVEKKPADARKYLDRIPQLLQHILQELEDIHSTDRLERAGLEYELALARYQLSSDELVRSAWDRSDELDH
jgi:hypothetical protein